MRDITLAARLERALDALERTGKTCELISAAHAVARELRRDGRSMIGVGCTVSGVPRTDLA